MTVLDLRPNSQDVSAFYLQKICQLLADTNVSRVSIRSAVTEPPPFSPTRHSILVNSLWSLSLVISLTCALLATMLHQWARRYVSFTQQPRYSPHKQARIRAFFSDGVDKLHICWVVEALPTLLHLSLFLFFAGLLIFLYSISQPVFGAVVWWVALSTVGYISITLFPIFWHNSPYYAPLSSTIWFLYVGIQYTVFKALSSQVFSCFFISDICGRFGALKDRCHKRLLEGIRKTAHETAWELSSEIDVRVLGSTFDALVEDGAREEFFEAIPGFYNSRLVNGLEEHLSDEFSFKFEETLYGFLDRTLSSNSIYEPVRGDRVVICLNAAHVVLPPARVLQILSTILREPWREFLQSVEMGHSIRRWGNSSNEAFTPHVRRIVRKIIPRVRERDKRWFALVKDEFDIPDHVFRSYVGHGDSVSLAAFIHITRQVFHTDSPPEDLDLGALSQFDLRHTLPALQHEFCSLWNEIVQRARGNGNNDSSLLILKQIQHIFLSLHRRTDSVPTAFSTSTSDDDTDQVLDLPSLYPLCSDMPHCPGTMHHVRIHAHHATTPYPNQPCQHLTHVFDVL